MIFSKSAGVTCFMRRSLPAHPHPLIVTARLDGVSQRYFDELRQQHFPSERNYLSAHLTIFHALPVDAIEDVTEVLAEMASRTGALSAEASGLRSVGNGVAFTIRSPGWREFGERLQRLFTHD